MSIPTAGGMELGSQRTAGRPPTPREANVASHGDRERFERHASEALARNEALGAVTWLASTQVDLAYVLATEGFAGDGDRAADLLAACLATCHERDMPALANRAESVRGRLAAPSSP